MKDEAELPTDVHIENVEKVFIKKVKRLGNTGYVSVHRRHIGMEVIVILPMAKGTKVRKLIRA
jgi:putative transposon-encoded protein